MINKMKKSELKQLVLQVLKEDRSPSYDEMDSAPDSLVSGKDHYDPRDNEPEEEQRLDLYMVILSYLSDLQEEAPQVRKKLNFVKSLVMQMNKGVTRAPESLINAAYKRWVG